MLYLVILIAAFVRLGKYYSVQIVTVRRTYIELTFDKMKLTLYFSGISTLVFVCVSVKLVFAVFNLFNFIMKIINFKVLSQIFYFLLYCLDFFEYLS